MTGINAMKKLLSLAVLLISLSAHAQSSAASDLDRAREPLKARAIERVMVLRIPDDVTTRTNVTQEWMRKDSSYTVTLNEGFEPALSSLLDDVTATKSERESDLRWGLLLYDRSGREVASLFVDHFGKTGYVNGKSAEFSLNMSERMRRFIRDLR
jgi:hypothetical protein